MASTRRLPFWLAGLLLVVGCTTSGSGGSGAATGTPVPAATQSPVRMAAGQGAWRQIAPAPIPPAGGMAAAWTGRQLVVWGGQSQDGYRQGAEDGAAYDPAADRWEVLPPAPVAGRLGASAVWTGREVLFWGGQAAPDRILGDGAAYDPAARRWRALPAAPSGPRTGHQAVWTGREMIVWGGYPSCCPVDSVLHDRAAAAYDPATNLWRRLSDVPAPWSGDDGTAVTAVLGDRPAVWRQGRLAVYDPGADRWTEVPGALPPPEPPTGQPPAPSRTGDPFAVGAVAGGEVFTWTGAATGRLEGQAYRPAPEPASSTPAATGDKGSVHQQIGWRRTAPLDGQYGATVVAGGPGRIFAAAGQSARVLEYEIADDQWEELPLPPVPTRSAATLLWTGSELLFWGGIGDEGPEMDGAMWHCC